MKLRIYNKAFSVACLLALCFIIAQSCKGGAKNSPNHEMDSIPDTTHVRLFSADNCDQVAILSDNNGWQTLTAGDAAAILDYLRASSFDEAMTNGPKIKMVAPDYLLQVEFKDGEKATVQIWTHRKTDTLINIDTRWYRNQSGVTINPILDKYVSQKK